MTDDEGLIREAAVRLGCDVTNLEIVMDGERKRVVRKTGCEVGRGVIVCRGYHFHGPRRQWR